MAGKLTQEEAERLLNMLKQSLIDYIRFPDKGTSTEFEVIGDTKRDTFAVRIYRGRINNNKYELGARIKADGIMLLELHITPGKPHINPDGQKITDSHWHVYSEEYYRAMAYPADDIQSENFVENTILFFDKFNIIKKPTVFYQTEITE